MSSCALMFLSVNMFLRLIMIILFATLVDLSFVFLFCFCLRTNNALSLGGLINAHFTCLLLIFKDDFRSFNVRLCIDS